MTPSIERTAKDFPSHEELFQALDVNDSDGCKDWELNDIDASTTLPQTKEGEIQRLLTLLSYNILDTAAEEEFEIITKEAQLRFQVPIAVVSLVDLGRQWFKSIQGLDAKQTPRSCAFCAHVIQRTTESGVMVVADATKDFRFKDNPLVKGGPQIRFYAGAPLISPEGPTLGSLCIIDFKPHPEGLSDQQEELLQSMASEVVYSMIQRVSL